MNTATTHTVTLSYAQVKLVRLALFARYDLIDCMPLTQIDGPKKAAALADIDATIAQLDAILATYLRNGAIEVAA